MTPSNLDHCSLLRQELMERIARKRAYSANAFARDIGLSRGFLSQVLSKKRKLSEKSALAIAQKLKWGPRKRKLFLNLVRFDLHDSREGKEILWKEIEAQVGRSKSFVSLEHEAFKLISNWYHLAILELCEVEGFQSEPAWVAEKLGLTTLQAKDAIERLIQLGLLAREGEGLVKVRDNAIKSVPSDAIKKFHEQHLENAKRALWSYGFHERDITGTTVCSSPQQIEKAKKLIQEFRSELTALLESGPKTHVYHLAVQLFPLTKGSL